MLTISVELLAGIYRADPDGSVPLGNAVTGEWPPSPARLLAAFIAADGTGDRCTATTGLELEKLSTALPPTIQADVSPCVKRELHNPVIDRFVVASDKDKNTVQEFPGRKSTVKRSGIRVAPRRRVVRFVYDLECDSQDLAALRYRAARIGYLGCSDSPVRVMVSEGAPSTDPTLAEFTPDKQGSLGINTHTAGDVARWDRLFDESRRRGVPRVQYHSLRHRTLYRLPGVDPEPKEDSGRVVGWLRFDRALSGRRVVVVAHRLKDAVMSQYGRIHGNTTVPEVLHGHRRGSGFDLVRFLPLPNVGHVYSDGRIHGAAVWLPPGIGPAEQARIRRAVLAVDRIRVGATRVSVESWDDHPGRDLWATNPFRWRHHPSQPFERQYWASVFPVLLERHGPVTLDVLNRMAANAGLPPVTHHLESRVPFISGGIQLAPSETVRRGHSQHRPYAHFLVRFSESVVGPVVIGAGRSHGLGLFAPMKPEDLRGLYNGA